MDFGISLILLVTWVVVGFFHYVVRLDVFLSAKYSTKQTFMLVYTLWLIIVTGITYHIVAFAAIIPIYLVYTHISDIMDPGSGLVDFLLAKGIPCTRTLTVRLAYSGHNFPRKYVESIVNMLFTSTNVQRPDVIFRRVLPVSFDDFWSSGVTAMLQQRINLSFRTHSILRLSITIAYMICFDWLWTELTAHDSSTIFIVFYSLCALSFLGLCYIVVNDDMTRRCISKEDISKLSAEMRENFSATDEIKTDLTGLSWERMARVVNQITIGLMHMKLDVCAGITGIKIVYHDMMVCVEPFTAVSYLLEEYSSPLKETHWGGPDKYHIPFKGGPDNHALLPGVHFLRFIGRSERFREMIIGFLSEAFSGLPTLPDELLYKILEWVGKNPLLENFEKLNRIGE